MQIILLNLSKIALKSKEDLRISNKKQYLCSRNLIYGSLKS